MGNLIVARSAFSVIHVDNEFIVVGGDGGDGGDDGNASSAGIPSVTGIPGYSPPPVPHEDWIRRPRVKKAESVKIPKCPKL